MASRGGGEPDPATHDRLLSFHLGVINAGRADASVSCTSAHYVAWFHSTECPSTLAPPRNDQKRAMGTEGRRPTL